MPTPSCRMAVLLLVLPWTVATSTAQSPVVWQPNFTAAQQQAKKSGLPLLALVQAKGEKTSATFADAKITTRAQSFISVTLPADSAAAKKIDGAIAGSVIFLNSHGEALTKLEPGFTVADLAEKMSDALDQSRKQAMERLKNPKEDAASQKAAIESYARIGGSVADLIPILAHKNGDVRSTIRKVVLAHVGEGMDWCLLSAMGSPDADVREACHPVAVEATHATKIRPAKFWKEASDDERTVELDKWREGVFGKVPALNRLVLDFANANFGNQVDSGECADLAAAALKAAKGQPIKFVDKTYVWGRALEKNENGLPGDIVQLENAKFGNGISASHHTQVIRRVLGPGQYEVLEQNMNGRHTVGLGKLNVKLLTQGTVVIFRPLPIDDGK